MERKIIAHTGDQSPTIYVPALDEHYHSVHGALQESQHLYLQSGLEQFAPGSSLQILEMGLGTGLNALLTALRASAQKYQLRYHSVEKYPLTEPEWSALPYPAMLAQPKSATQLYQKIHRAPWGEWHSLHAHFSLYKEQNDFRRLALPAHSYHLIYFDAFAPEAQPELWTEAIFAKMAAALQPGGILVSYCVKGSVRRAMQAAGLVVEKIPGPPGKREMSRAQKPQP